MKRFLYVCLILVLSLTISVKNVSADPQFPLPRIPICGDQDGSETPFSTSCPDFSVNTNVQAYKVTSTTSTEFRFDFVFREATYNNELGFFLVDDDSFAIEGRHPGDNGYLDVALQRATIIFSSGSDAYTANQTFTFQPGDILAFFIVQDNTLSALRQNNPNNASGGSPVAFFSIDRLNPDGLDHFVGFQNNSAGITQFGFEDLTGGGDVDFDDVVYNIIPPLNPILVGPCASGFGIEFINFPIFPSITLIRAEGLLYSYREIINFNLEGRACPNSFILSPGENPSFIVRSSKGETRVTERGEFETELDISETSTWTVTAHPIDNSVSLKFDTHKRVGDDNLELEEALEDEHNFRPRPPAYALLYVVAVGAIATALIVSAPATAVAGVIAVLMLFYTGPTPVTPPGPAIITSSSLVMQQAGYVPDQAIVDDLVTVFGSEFINASTVNTLTIDSAQKGPGQIISLNGSNFTPNSLVYVSLNLVSDPRTMIDTAVQSDGNGSISGQIKLPNDASSGRWLLTSIDTGAMYNTLMDFANGRITSLHYSLAANSVVIPEYGSALIDVKPGSSSNPINLKSKDDLPVTILTTPTFDASTIDPLSVRFGPYGASESHRRGHLEDVDGDGDTDLMVHFSIGLTGISAGDTKSCIIGQTTKGDFVVGCDAIRVME